MTFATVIALLPAVFKFWDQIVILIKTLQKTPEEQHEQLMKKISAEGDAYAQADSRPDWS